MFAVARRWLDPNGDGDCSDGVDGFRLDVAERMPMGFWRSFADFVRGVNPDAILIAELWWKKWPDELLDPAPWIQGGAFHGSMNYRWYAPARRFFTGKHPKTSPSAYFAELKAIERGISVDSLQAMMNVAATHDTPRLGTSLLNRQTKYKFHASPRRGADYNVARPNSEALAQQRLLLVQQFTWIGAPHIYYGDEVGMWGADDPDCRKPMIWNDVAYTPERQMPNGTTREADPVEVNDELFQFYKKLIAIRRQHTSVLARGKTEWVDLGENSPLVAFRRFNKQRQVIVILNRSDSPVVATVPVIGHTAFIDALEANQVIRTEGQRISVPILPVSARVLIEQ
jgi:glycosidase